MPRSTWCGSSTSTANASSSTPPTPPNRPPTTSTNSTPWSTHWNSYQQPRSRPRVLPPTRALVGSRRLELEPLDWQWQLIQWRRSDRDRWPDLGQHLPWGSASDGHLRLLLIQGDGHKNGSPSRTARGVTLPTLVAPRRHGSQLRSRQRRPLTGGRRPSCARRTWA